MKQRIVLLCILFVFSAMASWFGTGLSYPREFTPKSHPVLFEKIARDGWIEDGGVLRLPFLFSRGNRAELSLGGWRPGGQEPAEIEVALCGERIALSKVEGPTKLPLFLSGTCQPRELQFQVNNPFQGTPTDPRALGTELKNVSVGSVLGLPLLQPKVYLFSCLFIFIFSVLVALKVTGPRSFVAGLSVVLFSGLAISFSDFQNWDKLFQWWSVLVLLIGGWWLSDLVPETGSIPSAIHHRDRKYFLWFIIFCGGALRFYGLNFGLPMNFHPDEVPKMLAIERMVAHQTLDPQYFLHPTLLLYSAYFVNWIGHMFGFFEGEFLHSIFLSGRIVSATAGTLSIAFVYGVGTLLFRPSIGLMSAAFFAVFPLHVTTSRYLKEDALLLFFVLACVYFTVLAAARKKPWILLFASLAAGCSASVKYSGALSGIIPFGAAWLVSGGLLPNLRFLLWAVGSSLLLPLAFVACSPYTVLNSEKFITDFNYERKHMSKGHTAAISSWSQYWLYHVSRSLWSGMTQIPLALGLVGIGVAFRRFWNPMLFLVALFLLYYLPAEFVKAKPAPQPERYVVPCLPFLAILASCALWLIQQRFKRVSVSVLLFFAILLFPLSRTIGLAFEVPIDTRLKMATWIKENLPCGSKVYIDHKRYSPELDDACHQVTYAPRANIPRDLVRETLTEKDQEYLLLSSLWYDRYFSQPYADQRVARMIRRLQDELEVVHQESPMFGTYGFNNPTVTLYRVPSGSGS